MKRITFELGWPPSINNYYTRSLRGVFTNKKVKAFRDESFVRLKSLSGLFSSTDRLSLDVVLYPPDKRKTDIDNRLKGLIDSIQYANVFPNDEQIDEITVKRGCLFKKGKCIISISVLDNPQ